MIEGMIAVAIAMAEEVREEGLEDLGVDPIVEKEEANELLVVVNVDVKTHASIRMRQMVNIIKF